MNISEMILFILSKDEWIYREKLCKMFEENGFKIGQIKGGKIRNYYTSKDILVNTNKPVKKFGKKLVVAKFENGKTKGRIIPLRDLRAAFLEDLKHEIVKIYKEFRTESKAIIEYKELLHGICITYR